MHLHSTISDGKLTPSQLVELAHRRRVRALSLTDHDNTDGVDEAQEVGDRLGLRVIPGIELSADVPGASIHVLGLFLEHHDTEFQRTVSQFREARITRAQSMVETLTRLGAPISIERVFQLAGEGSVGRPHVAQALIEAGHVSTMAEAFDRFLANGQPAYLEGFRLSPAEAVQLVHSVGGFASWAHPLEIDGKDWRSLLPDMLAAGIDGLEAYYSKPYPPDSRSALLSACRTNHLVPTVGSDFHGFAGMEQLPGSVESPPDLLDRLEGRLSSLAARTDITE